jgi:hypothetical protein
MNNSTKWREIKYDEVFEEETRHIVRRRQADPNCKVEDLEGILKNLYIMDGADNDGRGSLQDIIMAARIAAYECYIAAWKAETKAAPNGNI